MADLGKLERVELRDIWQTEAQDFTPWLAQEENLKVLASVLELELELEAQERNVGPFRADILCKNVDDGSWVLIENQIERTDHTHLGQLLTYASGLQAVTIVWVAARFTDEHRASLDWLNEITDDTFRFFGLEVELWKIGNSPAAPKFNVVSKPNDWSRSVSTAVKRIATEGMTKTKAAQLEYWISFRNFMIKENSRIKLQKPFPQHYANFTIGRAGFLLGALLNSRQQTIGVELYLGGEKAKAYFWLLSEQKEEIEEDLGFGLEWMELPERKASRLLVKWNDKDPANQDAWPMYHRWMKEKLEKFDSVFRLRIKDLNADEWQQDVM